MAAQNIFRRIFQLKCSAIFLTRIINSLLEEDVQPFVQPFFKNVQPFLALTGRLDAY